MKKRAILIFSSLFIIILALNFNLKDHYPIMASCIDTEVSIEDLTTPVAETNNYQATIINTTSIIVTSYAELKKYLGENNTYSTFYLGNDIQMDGTGLPIHSGKTNVIIDGCPPGTESVRFALKEHIQTAVTGQIYIASTNTTTKSVTVKNLKYFGQSKNGMVAIQNLSNNINFTVDHVTYIGPQAVDNPSGTTTLRDSEFTIQKGANNAEEVAEAKTLILESQVEIDSKSPTTAVFGGATTLTVKKDSDVVVNGIYYFLSANNANITVEEGASLVYNGKYGMTKATQYIKNLLVMSDANLYIKVRENDAISTLNISTELTVNTNATMQLFHPSTTNSAIWAAPNININIENPKKFLIYSPNYKPIRNSSGNITMNVSSGTINMWKTSDGYGKNSIDDLPDYIWNKNGDDLITVKVVFSGDKVSSVTTNLEPQDATKDLTKLNFLPNIYPYYMVGQVSGALDHAYDNGLPFTGKANRDADLSVTYQYSSSPNQTKTVYGTALDGNIQIDISPDVFPLVNTPARLVIHYNEMKAYKEATVARAGLNFAFVPKSLSYGTHPISSKEKIYKREDQNWQINISDSRLIQTPWALSVRLKAPLSNGQDQLEGILFFVNDIGEEIPLLDQDILVFESNGVLRDTVIQWKNDKGILIKLSPRAGLSNQKYEGILQWILSDVL